MDFAIPDRIAHALPAVRELVDGELLPLEPALWRDGFAALEPRLEPARARARELGLFAPHVPRAHAGGGLSLVELAFLGEELGRSPLGHFVFNCQAPDAGNMELLVAHGSPEQQRRFLAPLVRGELRSCFTMTEPEHAGSNPVWLGTRARREGDVWVIDGHKWFASAAEGAAFAICMAVTDPEAARPHERASLLIVPTDTPGFERVRNVPVMGDPGGGYASHAEVRYRGCRVPLENLVGAPGRGFALAQERLGPGRIQHCMRWLGICARAFELTCRHALGRELAPGRPLAAQQAFQHGLAEMRAQIHAARLTVLHAAWRIDREGARAAREEIALIKFGVAGVLQRVLDWAIQAHGARGLTDETPLAYWYAHERAARIYDGPDEVHKDSVARHVLRGYGARRRRGRSMSERLPLDAPGAVRPGDEPDLARLEAWLRQAWPDEAGPLTVEQFPGGHSNLTYLLRLGTRELVLRRPPRAADIKSAHDMGREFRMLTRLSAAGVKVPRPLLSCEDAQVLGAPFYVMERVRGAILRGARPPEALALAPQARRRLAEALIDELADLHRLDVAAAGLAQEGRPVGYVARQVHGWSERYRAARTDDVPDAERVAAWLAERLPGDGGASVVHGDFKHDNLVLDPEDPTCIRAVLDWEMATVGDPLMDLGTSLAYWVDPDDAEEQQQLALGPTLLPGNPTRGELVVRYAARTGRDLSNVVFYYVFGLFKVVVIAQQIFARYQAGARRDPRFAALGAAVRVLSAAARRAAEAGRIDRLG